MLRPCHSGLTAYQVWLWQSMFQYGRSNVDWVLCLLDALCSSRDWATFEEEKKQQQPAALLHYKVGSCAAAHSCLSMLHEYLKRSSGGPGTAVCRGGVAIW
jgi:hypothetical protein